MSIPGSESRPAYITESEVNDCLDWQSVFDVIEQSLISVSNNNEELAITSSQPPRTFASAIGGVLLTMPGFIGNYDVLKTSDKKLSTLGCKLVTSFRNNQKRSPAIPNILATIVLFDTETGRLNCILEATALTAWRTAAASLVATKHLYFARNPDKKDNVLSIIGCGVQGESHAIGMMNVFNFTRVNLWNRTKSRAETLSEILNKVKVEIGKPSIEIQVFDKIEDCLANGDVVCTTTYANAPLVFRRHLKPNCHINAIGAGEVHHTELSQDVYDHCKVFIDHYAGANIELANLKSDIVGEVGEVILNTKTRPHEGITVFQSLGMAVEDAAIGQLIFEKYKLACYKTN